MGVPIVCGVSEQTSEHSVLSLHATLDCSVIVPFGAATSNCIPCFDSYSRGSTETLALPMPHESTDHSQNPSAITCG